MLKPPQYTLTLSIGILCLLLTLTAHANLDRLSLPPQSQLRWVGRDLVQNARELQIATLESKLTTESVIAFYSNLWESNAQDGSPGSIVENLGEWVIVSTVVDNSLLVVQQKPGTGDNQSTGFVSWTRLGLATSTTGQLLPEPAGSTLISHIRSTDFNQSVNNLGEQSASAVGTTSMLWNDASVASNFEFYRSAMQERGWTLVADRIDHASAALLFSKHGSTSEIALSEYIEEQSTKTLMITNHVTRGGFR